MKLVGTMWGGVGWGGSWPTVACGLATYFCIAHELRMIFIDFIHWGKNQKNNVWWVTCESDIKFKF